MSPDMPRELQAFVQAELNAGHYRSEQELVLDAIRLLQQEREATVSGIFTGLEDVAAGRTQPIDEAFEELRREFGDKESL
ncbi:MAG: type II toxin-antitoxin system ParD family antitoxin [Planctomycetaceae bacterium]|nr:type II toxin-antitoxin system ParD family antitoxin [Planctomycetaceae bacterium]